MSQDERDFLRYSLGEALVLGAVTALLHFAEQVLVYYYTPVLEAETESQESQKKPERR